MVIKKKKITTTILSLSFVKIHEYGDVHVMSSYRGDNFTVIGFRLQVVRADSQQQKFMLNYSINMIYLRLPMIHTEIPINSDYIFMIYGVT